MLLVNNVFFMFDIIHHSMVKDLFAPSMAIDR